MAPWAWAGTRTTPGFGGHAPCGMPSRGACQIATGPWRPGGGGGGALPGTTMFGDCQYYLGTWSA